MNENDLIPSKSHLQWQCRRGLLELDEVFLEFLEQHFDELPDHQKHEFVELLKYPDPDLQQWILLNAEPPDIPSVKNIIAIIHSKFG